MKNREDLEKLFEAALHEKEAPTRFGTPESQRKAAPAAFRKPVINSEVTTGGDQKAAEPLDHRQQTPFHVFQAAPPEPSELREDPLSAQAAKSLDTSLNAELEEILRNKIAREKRKKRREKLTALALFLGAIVGVSVWLAKNPEQMASMKQMLGEIRSSTDVKEITGQYQKSLDKVAVRGSQLDEASKAIGVDPDSVVAEDPGFDKEMSEMIGEDGGPTTSARDKLLREKFKSEKKTGF